MRIFRLMALLMCLSVLPLFAMAQDDVKDGHPTNALVPAEDLENKSEAPAGTKDQDFIEQPLDKQLCGYLTMNHTSYGNAILKAEKEQGVVQADMGSPHVKPPQVLSFPLTVDVAEYAGLDIPRGMELKPSLGRITVDLSEDNHILVFNDKTMTKSQINALVDLCTKEIPGVKSKVTVR